MKKKFIGICSVAIVLVAGVAFADDEDDNGNRNGRAPKELKVKPAEYDPDKTNIVTSEWVRHLGLPDNPGDRGNDPTETGVRPRASTQNWGLLLSKNGPTPTNAAAIAEIKGLEKILRDTHLFELGFDIRNGTHCGAGAPRFNVVTEDGVTHFQGCAHGTKTPNFPRDGWTRVRFSNAAAFPPIDTGARVKSISIVFDEGSDAGPDFTGLAIIDNIVVNGHYATKP